MAATHKEKSRTSVYLRDDFKAEAQKIFACYDMGLSEAFNLFLGQVVAEKGIPFDVRLPNDATMKAVEEARSGKVEPLDLDALKQNG